MRHVPAIGSLSILLFACCGACDRQFLSERESPPRDERKFTAEAEAATETRALAIRNELMTIQDHPWAGEYFHGDGLGINVSLLVAPNAGFLFQWHGCLGVYDRNFGPVTQEGEHLILHCKFDNNRRGFQGIATSLRPVRWGDRLYLIPDEQMVEFCNAVNSGIARERTSRGSFLIRVRDGRPLNPPVTGRPELPEPYARLLLDKEVRGTITAVGPTATHTGLGDKKLITTTVTLDRGAAHGLFEGMALYVHETESIQTVKVVKAADRTAIAVIEHVDTPHPRPKVGWKLSSRFHRD